MNDFGKSFIFYMENNLIKCYLYKYYFKISVDKLMALVGDVTLLKLNLIF